MFTLSNFVDTHFNYKHSLLQAAAAWALGQAGRHTPEHAKAVAQANVLPTLLQCYLRAGSSEDLQTKVGRFSTATEFKFFTSIKWVLDVF